MINGKALTVSVDDTTLTAKKENFISFTQQPKKICLSLHYNLMNSDIFVKAVEINNFKVKDFEINAAP